MKTETEAKVRAHGIKLQAIFPASKELDPVNLCRKLRRLETRAHRAAEDWCNGRMGPDQWATVSSAVIRDVRKVLGGNVPIFVNGDPRGYALKIPENYTTEYNLDIPKDWGGYGLLAPDLD